MSPRDYVLWLVMAAGTLAALWVIGLIVWDAFRSVDVPQKRFADVDEYARQHPVSYPPTLESDEEDGV